MEVTRLINENIKVKMSAADFEKFLQEGVDFACELSVTTPN